MTLLLYVGQQVSESMPKSEPRDYLGMTAGVAVVVAVMTVVFGIPAAYLSWTSNSLLEWNAGVKILCAAVAFFFGIEYMLAFAVLKADLIAELRRLKNANIGWFFS